MIRATIRVELPSNKTVKATGGGKSLKKETNRSLLVLYILVEIVDFLTFPTGK